MRIRIPTRPDRSEHPAHGHDTGAREITHPERKVRQQATRSPGRRSRARPRSPQTAIGQPAIRNTGSASDDDGRAAERRNQPARDRPRRGEHPDGIRRTLRGSGRRRRRSRPGRRGRRRRSGRPSSDPASQPMSAPTPITTRVTTISRAPASAGGNARGAAGSIGAEHSAGTGDGPDYVTAEAA